MKTPDARGIRRALPYRDELFVYAAFHLEPVRVVMPYEPVSRVQNGLHGAVVLRQGYLFGVGKDVLEIKDVTYGGAAELIYALVVVGDYRYVSPLADEEFYKLELRVVGVLKLVGKHTGELLPVTFQYGRPSPEEFKRKRDLVAEVYVAVLGHHLVILGVGGRELGVLLYVVFRSAAFFEPLREPGVLFRRYVLVLKPSDEPYEFRKVLRGISRRPVIIEGQFEDVFLEKYHAFGYSHDLEIGRKPHGYRVVMQYPVAEGMERGYPHGRISVRHETVHPLLHLVSGLFGEGKGEDLRGVHALFYEPGDASGDNARLARACSGYDKKRSVAVLHGLDLSFVEPFAQAKRGIVIQIRRHLGAEVIFLMALLPFSAAQREISARRKNKRPDKKTAFTKAEYRDMTR